MIRASARGSYDITPGRSDGPDRRHADLTMRHGCGQLLDRQSRRMGLLAEEFGAAVEEFGEVDRSGRRRPLLRGAEKVAEKRVEAGASPGPAWSSARVAGTQADQSRPSRLVRSATPSSAPVQNAPRALNS